VPSEVTPRRAISIFQCSLFLSMTLINWVGYTKIYNAYPSTYKVIWSIKRWNIMLRDSPLLRTASKFSLLHRCYILLQNVGCFNINNHCYVIQKEMDGSQWEIKSEVFEQWHRAVWHTRNSGTLNNFLLVKIFLVGCSLLFLTLNYILVYMWIPGLDKVVK